MIRNSIPEHASACLGGASALCTINFNFPRSHAKARFYNRLSLPPRLKAGATYQPAEAGKHCQIKQVVWVLLFILELRCRQRILPASAGCFVAPCFSKGVRNDTICPARFSALGKSFSVPNMCSSLTCDGAKASGKPR